MGSAETIFISLNYQDFWITSACTVFNSYRKINIIIKSGNTVDSKTGS